MKNSSDRVLRVINICGEKGCQICEGTRAIRGREKARRTSARKFTRKQIRFYHFFSSRGPISTFCDNNISLCRKFSRDTDASLRPPFSPPPNLCHLVSLRLHSREGNANEVCFSVALRETHEKGKRTPHICREEK